jgi:hypothetical protein
MDVKESSTGVPTRTVWPRFFIALSRMRQHSCTFLSASSNLLRLAIRQLKLIHTALCRSGKIKRQNNPVFDAEQTEGELHSEYGLSSDD